MDTERCLRSVSIPIFTLSKKQKNRLTILRKQDYDIFALKQRAGLTARTSSTWLLVWAAMRGASRLAGFYYLTGLSTRMVAHPFVMVSGK